MDAVGYKGPIAVAGDCTKVHPRLAYSTDFGGHILGSTLPLDECQVDEVEDIENVIDRIHKAKAEATQVRAILAKVNCSYSFTCLSFYQLMVLRFRFHSTRHKLLPFCPPLAKMIHVAYMNSSCHFCIWLHASRCMLFHSLLMVPPLSFYRNA